MLCGEPLTCDGDGGMVVWWSCRVVSCGSVRYQATCVSKLPSGKMKLRSHSRGHVLSVTVRVCRRDARSGKGKGCGKGADQCDAGQGEALGVQKCVTEKAGP